jgi:starch synthase (maltosyl-transferring)
MLIAYSKWDEATSEYLLIVVNLDPHHVQSGMLTLETEHFPIPASGSYEVQDLLSDRTFVWAGPRNYVSLDPSEQPAHIFRIGAAGNHARAAGRE